MTFTITPDDGALAPFFMERSPDRGDQVGDDTGKVIGLTDGLRTHIHQTAIATRTWVIGFSGLSAEEAYAFRGYVLETLGGAAEPFTLTWSTRTFSDSRLVPSTFEAVPRRDDVWDLQMTIRQEEP